MKTKLETNLNANFWGVNPYFRKLAYLLKQRNVDVEEYETRINGSNHTSIGTPSIVIFKGVQVGDNVEETDMRDLVVSYEPSKRSIMTKKEPKLPEKFIKTSQVSSFAASFLRAQGYSVSISVVDDLDEIRKIDFDLDSGIRFDLIDPRDVDPEVLKKELGLNW